MGNGGRGNGYKEGERKAEEKIEKVWRSREVERKMEEGMSTLGQQKYLLKISQDQMFLQHSVL